MINETVASVLEGGNLCETIPSCATLETYEETPIFIPVDITVEAVKFSARKLSGSCGPGGMDLEVQLGWILKLRENSARLRISVETFIDWLANGSLP